MNWEKNLKFISFIMRFISFYKFLVTVMCWFTATMLNANIMMLRIRYALPIIPILLTGTAYHQERNQRKITTKT